MPCLLRYLSAQMAALLQENPDFSSLGSIGRILSLATLALTGTRKANYFLTFLRREMFTSIQETSWSKITRTSFIFGTVLETLSGRNGAGCPAGPVPVNPLFYGKQRRCCCDFRTRRILSFP